MGEQAENDETLAQMSEMIRQRMKGRGFAVASNEVSGPLIERSFKEGIALLEAHLAVGRPFLFGSKPSFGDFGIAAQLYQALIDPTAGMFMNSSAPRVVEWCNRMLWPQPPGPEASWEPWESL